MAGINQLPAVINPPGSGVLDEMPSVVFIPNSTEICNSFVVKSVNVSITKPPLLLLGMTLLLSRRLL